MTDTETARAWLRQVWFQHDFAAAVRHASPALAGRLDMICVGKPLSTRQVRRAATSVARYILRASGRPTPFGLFAGVAPVSVAPVTRVRWGNKHRPIIRVDAEWLSDVITRLEACPQLLERLDVAFSNLAAVRGGQLQVPRGPNRVSVPYTEPVAAVREAAAAPVQFGALAARLAGAYPDADAMTARSMLTVLVERGFLITSLRAPFTVICPLSHLTDRLHDVGAGDLPDIAPLLRELDILRAEVRQHNREHAPDALGARTRQGLVRRMRDLSPAGRTALAVDLQLDCDVQLPRGLVCDLERAADLLVRLTRRPAGQAAWRDYHARFCERYGTGVLVPLADVVDPNAGLGYPAGYPGSGLPAPVPVPPARQQRLLALAWQAMADRTTEIELSEEDVIDSLTDGEHLDELQVPPHVEMAARVNAASSEALERGDYTLTIAPARAAGTLTSRFTPLATGAGLEQMYRSAPTASEAALPVQMSFPPVYPHAENICRTPAYLSHILPLGEHRTSTQAVLPLDDLAITATQDRLHLVSISQRRVVEPQVFHALALEKQPPPLARFLAHLTRAFTADWHDFDWGPHARHLPFLPRIRFQRIVIAPARWRLTGTDLSPGKVDQQEWRQALDRWRKRWRCPSAVELRDGDRSLRISLDEPAHAFLLHAHLERHGHAILTESTTAEDCGWLDGHVHEVAVPLVTTRPPAPCPLRGSLPLVTNTDHGHSPGSSESAWLQAKIFSHPEQHEAIITERLSELLTTLGDTAHSDGPAVPVPCWFVRYRSPYETDHLRLRVYTPDSENCAAAVTAVADWAAGLRRDGAAGSLVFDTYRPEVGRYGPGEAMRAAEAVFGADTRVVTAGLRHLSALAIDPLAWAAANMLHIAGGFLGGLEAAAAWLIDRTAPTAAPIRRSVMDQAATLAHDIAVLELTSHLDHLVRAWRDRTAALANYRERLPADADPDAVLESLLHMHHNRAMGIDRDRERQCRRLARQSALAQRAQR
ncbi:lantibiotic dehydratase [Actinomadura rubrisoli]|uniref:lantibiotic dehydratase n=1 Tax=Actinomadura rubrisoli TaxID=2530368 RepID=UPI001A9D6B3C|nr:lantibiotic dehydratase [Actinomadura rubrisoli]